MPFCPGFMQDTKALVVIINCTTILSIKMCIDGPLHSTLESALHKVATVRLPTTHQRKLSKLDEPDMQDSAAEVGTSS